MTGQYTGTGNTNFSFSIAMNGKTPLALVISADEHNTTNPLVTYASMVTIRPAYSSKNVMVVWYIEHRDDYCSPVTYTVDFGSNVIIIYPHDGCIINQKSVLYNYIVWWR